MEPSPEKQKKIKALVNAARHLEPKSRKAFLKHACEGNQALLHEVEALLAEKEPSTESPHPDSGAQTLAPLTAKIVGQTIGQYKVISFLGHGGMGEVYLAQDTRLARKVALKLLPESISKDDERLRRFQREARSASALNHPNVCVIHEVGETEDGRPFIAMEYIDGITLRQRLAMGPLPSAAALDIILQAASALAAAHEAGVVHRDIKPENLMVRRDGYVKVLDFGLAKLTERYAVASDSEALTFPVLSTQSGQIMGTAHYMSPEQARRREVDERSDIWSLGVVFYEMLTGHFPFTGETSSHVIVSILEKEPHPLKEYLADAPAELEWVLKKALRKDRDQRYQTVKELMADLDDIKPRVKPLAPATQATASFKKPETAPASYSSAFKSISETLRRPRVSIGALTFVGILLAIGFWFIFQAVLTGPELPFQKIRLTRLTNTGKSISAALSPDGKYFAHVVGEGGQQSLVLTDIAAGSNLIINPPSDVQYLGITFARDGHHIYYVRQEKGGASQLNVVPTISGPSRKILSAVDSPVTLSPDGKQIAFIRLLKNTGEYLLMLAQADGSGERVLASRKNGDLFSMEGLSWSPNGNGIACVTGSYAGGFHMNIVEVLIKDGTERLLTKRQWFSVPQAAWLADSKGLIVSAAEDSMSPYQLWYISYPGGDVHNITSDANDYTGISLSMDPTALSAIQSSSLRSIWFVPEGAADRATQITSSVGRTYGLALTPEGRVIYSNMASGKLDIWTINSDGTQRSQLTFEGSNYHPAVSRDGRYIFFSSNRSGTFNIWRMDADGNNPKQLSNGSSDFNPYPSPDGRWVLYHSGGAEGGKTTLWRVPAEGGKPEQLTSSNSSFPVVSPDGKQIACRHWDEKESRLRIAVIPFDGGPPTKMFSIPIRDWQRIRWTPDGQALTYVDTAGGVSNIWQQPLDGRPARQLTAFTSDRIFSYEWAGDRKQLVCERGVETNDVVLISDLK